MWYNKVFSKKTRIIISLILALVAINTVYVISQTENSQTIQTETEEIIQTETDGSSKNKEEIVPTEYKSALRSAKLYNDMMHMSKQGLYEQLTSEYGEKFSAEAAQYAIENVEANWYENALKSAQVYQNMMNMSPRAIYDQLVSNYGGKFTPEEAQYAINNLE